MKAFVRILLATALLFGQLAPSFAAQGNTVLPVTGTISGLQEQEFINAALDAAMTCSIGGSAPANATGGVPVQGQCWWNTATAGTMTLETYDGANWDVILSINTSTSVVSVPNSALANSSITIAGHVVALGGAQALAAADLSNGTTGTGSVVLAASPALTGAPTAPTPTFGDNTTKIPTTAFVQTAVSSASGAALPSASGLVITTATATTSTLTANNAVLVNSSGKAVLLSGGSVSLSSATSGAGGLDTGSIANSTWYYVWLIYNGSTASAVYSLSSTSPTLPSGYTFSMRAGAVRTNSSAQFYTSLQNGNRAQWVVGGSTVSAQRVAATGSGGGSGFVSISIADYLPPTAVRVFGSISCQGGQSVFAAPNPNYGGPYPAQIFLFGVSGTASMNVPFDFALETTQVVYYAGTNTSGPSISVIGWVDNINAS
jgi:hypothetical protein